MPDHTQHGTENLTIGRAYIEVVNSADSTHGLSRLRARLNPAYCPAYWVYSASHEEACTSVSEWPAIKPSTSSRYFALAFSQLKLRFTNSSAAAAWRDLFCWDVSNCNMCAERSLSEPLLKKVITSFLK